MTSTVLHLLWLTENYYPNRGGMAQSCDRIVQALRQRGVRVDVVHFTRRAGHWATLRKSNGRYLACPIDHDPPHTLNRLWNWLASDAECKTLTHVVAFGGVLPLLAGPVYAAWLNRPLVTLVRGNDFDVGVFTPRRHNVLREALERAARVCVVSTDKLDKIRALFPCTDPVWIPNGIDLEAWQAQPFDHRQAQEWRRQTVGPARRVAGMFGHIKKKKGGLFFLQELDHSGYLEHFHLLFVGDVEEEVLVWLNNHDTEVAYSHYPFMEHFALIPYYLACDLVVLPSFYDGLPNVLLEAMALGVPLLASTAGGITDFLTEGQHGFLFAAGDQHACRHAIQRATRMSVAEQHRMGHACQALVQDRLHHRLEAERYHTVFLETMRQYPPSCQAALHSAHIP
jgi:glycogen(starch) synthase